MKKKEIEISIEIQTEFGNTFKDNIFGLQYFMDFGFVIPAIEPLLRGFTQTIEDNEEKFDMQKVIGTIKEIEDEEPKEVTLGETADMLKDQMKQLEKLSQNFYSIKLSERLFAYYIFSISAYVDAYCSDLVDFIIEKATKNFVRKRAKDLDSNRNALDKFYTILKSLPEEMNDIVNKIKKDEKFKEYSTTFRELIDLRNEIAHKKPEAELTKIHDRFNHIETYYGRDLKVLKDPKLENGVQFANYDEIEILEVQLKTLKSVGYHIYFLVAYIESIVIYSINNHDFD